MSTKGFGLLLLLAVTACENQMAPPQEQGLVKTVDDKLIIENNTQIEVADLRMGAYNFADDSWVDENSQSQSGRSCALQVFVRDKSAENQKLRVHRGQTFKAGGKTFEIVDVTEGQLHLRVR